MAASYKTLFTIEFLHEYFNPDGACKVLSLAPTPACRRLFERYRLLFRPTPNGGSVSYSVQPGIDFLALFNETSPFAFALHCCDADFSRYTDLGTAGDAASPASTLFHFDNLETHTAAVGGIQKLLLHPPGKAFRHGALPVWSGQTRLAFDPPLAAARIRVLDPLSRQAVLDLRSPAQEARGFDLNLNGLPEGQYQLAINRKKPRPFYLSATPAVRQWGMLEIFPGGSALAGQMPAAGRVLDPQNRPEPKAFTLSLNARHTLWRYYVFSNAPAERSHADSLVYGQNRRLAQSGQPEAGRLGFVRKPEPVSIEGRMAWIFESSQPIPLWRLPAEEQQFTLKTDGCLGGAGQTYPLPYAQGNAAKLEVLGGKRRMVSEIFVYL